MMTNEQPDTTKLPEALSTRQLILTPFLVRVVALAAVMILAHLG